MLTAVPVPVRISFCGLVTSLSVTVTLALRVPRAAGVNVTVMEQLEFGARLLPQVLVSLKSERSVPPTAILVIVMAVLPRLVMVAVCAALDVPTAVPAKVKLAGANFTPVPVPLRAAVCVPPAPTTLNVADCLPSAVGSNSTETEQFAPAARVEPQLLALMGNSEALAPVTETLEIETAPVPALVRVATLAALVLPMTTMPHVRLVGNMVTSVGVIGP